MQMPNVHIPSTTEISNHPVRSILMLAGIGLAGYALWRSSGGDIEGLVKKFARSPDSASTNPSAMV